MRGSGRSKRYLGLAAVGAAVALALALGGPVPNAGAEDEAHRLVFRELGALVFNETFTEADGVIYKDRRGRRRLGTEHIFIGGLVAGPAGELAVAETVRFDLDDGTFVEFLTANVAVFLTDPDRLDIVGQGIVTMASDPSLVGMRTRVQGTLTFTPDPFTAEANRAWSILSSDD